MTTEMRVLITGAKGQLGIELKRQFIHLIDRGEVSVLVETDLDNLDITIQEDVSRLLGETVPDVVINCAAYTNVDGCEKDAETAFRVNALGARNLAVAAFGIGAKIVQISTDYVFEGNADKPLREYDPVNPQCVYGKSKELGERLVRATNPRHFILRTAWLFGDGNNFVRTMLKMAGERDELGIVNDQYGSPTSTVDLGRCIIRLIKTEAYGTYHATCQGECSWFEFARKIFEYKGISVRVYPLSTVELGRPAPRPKYSVLDNFMLRLIGLDTFRPWEEALQEYLAKT